MPRPHHEKWMRLSLEAAWKGRRHTSPNPMVGACLVKSNRLIRLGYHQKFGGPHAEAKVLKNDGKACGATLYITFEPCSTWGKTAPCTDLILKSGIKEVVIGSMDPNPKHHGKGVRLLRRHGIKVVTGVLRSEIEEQNAYFFKWIKRKIPFVTLKMAVTLDGKIATAEGNSRWITSAKARQFVHQLRDEQDGVMVGKNTFLLDNPRLTTERSKNQVRPWRIIVLGKGNVNPRARIFRGTNLTLLAVSEKHLSGFVKKIPKSGKTSFNLLGVKEKNGKLDIRDLLKKLGALGIAKILVEGGGELAWSFLSAGQVDRMTWMIAPKIIGGRKAKTAVEGEGVKSLAKAFRFHEVRHKKIGDDWLFEGRIN